MNRKKLIKILITLGCVVLLAVLLHIGGGRLAELFRAHMGR